MNYKSSEKIRMLESLKVYLERFRERLLMHEANFGNVKEHLAEHNSKILLIAEQFQKDKYSLEEAEVPSAIGTINSPSAGTERSLGKGIHLGNVVAACADPKLAFNFPKMDELFGIVIEGLRVSNQSGSAPDEYTERIYLAAGMRLAASVSVMLSHRISMMNLAGPKSPAESADLLLSSKEFFCKYFGKLKKLEGVAPRTECIESACLEAYLQSRRKHLESFLDGLLKETSSGSPSLYHVITTKKEIWGIERNLFNALFEGHLQPSGDSKFLQYFYEAVVLRYKQLIKRKILAEDDVARIHSVVFGLVCSIEDAFLKKAIFVNTFDEVRSFVESLWNTFKVQASSGALVELTSDGESQQKDHLLDNQLERCQRFFDLFTFFENSKAQADCASEMIALLRSSEGQQASFKCKLESIVAYLKGKKFEGLVTVETGQAAMGM
jgi:hypothetical protein